MGFPHMVSTPRAEPETAIRERAQILMGLLDRYGALLLRGMPHMDAEKFERTARYICKDLISENGEHDRSNISSAVFTPIFYPETEKIKWHNENSFNRMMPGTIFFHCVRPALEGGETPIVDTRVFVEKLPSGLRARFEERGIMYVRTYQPGFGQDWRRILGVSTKAEVAAACDAHGISHEWRGSTLITRSRRPAIVGHPRTGRPCWVAQPTHWHPASLPRAQRNMIRATFPPGTEPRQCHFGDGAPIEDGVMDELEAIYQDLEVATPWDSGDLLIVDNFSAAHARNPFQGPRTLLIAMGNLVPLDL